MAFGLSAAIQLVSRSLTSSRAGRRLAAKWSAARFKPVCDRSETGSAPPDLLASWIATDRPNSITLSSSLAGRRPARKRTCELVCELDSVMEFGLS